jgi:hypothetical protein
MITTYVLVLILASAPDKPIPGWEYDKRGQPVVTQFATLAECNKKLDEKSEKLVAAAPNESFSMGCVPFSAWERLRDRRAAKDMI